MSNIAYIAQTRVVKGVDGLRDRRIVFYHDAQNVVTPYIVHTEVFNHDGNMFRVHGHYHDQFDRGWEKFCEKAKSLLNEELRNV